MPVASCLQPRSSSSTLTYWDFDIGQISRVDGDDVISDFHGFLNVVCIVYHMNKSGGRCGYTIETDELPEEHGGWSCWRPEWGGTDKCIWHANKEDKPKEEIKNVRDSAKERLDGAILRNTELRCTISFADCTLIGSDFSGSSLRDVSFKNADMRNSNFSGSSLSDVNLTGVKLQNSQLSTHFFGCDLSNGRIMESDLTRVEFLACKMEDCHLSNSDLTDSTLVDSNLTGAWLAQSDLSESNLKACDFTDAVLQGADLSRTRSLAGAVSSFKNANLSDSLFEAADLGPIDFRNAGLAGAVFTHGRFEEADFSEANLIDADLSQAKLEDTSFVDSKLVEANFSGSWLNNVDMSGAILQRADFTNSNPNEASFKNTDMIEVDCTDANMLRADFSNSDLRRATLEDANLTETIFQEANLHHASLSGSYLERAVFTRSNLFDSNFSKTQLYGAVFTDAQINKWTRFEDHYSDDIPVLDRTIGSEDFAQEDRRTKIAWVYRRLEDLFRANALPEQARNMYLKRKEIRRHGYRKDDDYLRFGYATLSKYIANHGDGPWHVIGTSLVIILISTVLYPLLGGIGSQEPPMSLFVFDFSISLLPTLPDWITTILVSLHISVVTFTNLGYGSLQPVSGAAQAVATVESFLGALLMALLVFILGRRATW